MTLAQPHGTTGAQVAPKAKPTPLTLQTWSKHMGLRTYLCLGLGGLGWPQKALAQDGAHSSSIGMVPKHWAEL